jgi:hypothetical protein
LCSAARLGGLHADRTVLHVGLAGTDLRHRRRLLGLQLQVLEPKQFVAGLDAVALPHLQVLDDAGHLGLDVDELLGTDLARGGDQRAQLGEPFDLGGDHLGRRRRLQGHPDGANGKAADENEQERGREFHAGGGQPGARAGGQDDRWRLWPIDRRNRRRRCSSRRAELRCA